MNFFCVYVKTRKKMDKYIKINKVKNKYIIDIKKIEQQLIDKIREDFDGLNEFSSELKNYLDEEVVFSEQVKDATSHQASELFKQIKNLRFNSKEVNDTIATQMGDKVIDNLVKTPEIYAMFIHYALRSHAHAIGEKAWVNLGHNPDTITEGANGLDLAIDDIPLYIIEHYGDDSDSNRVKPKFKGALELFIFSINLICFSAVATNSL